MRRHNGVVLRPRGQNNPRTVGLCNVQVEFVTQWACWQASRASQLCPAEQHTVDFISRFRRIFRSIGLLNLPLAPGQLESNRRNPATGSPCSMEDGCSIDAPRTTSPAGRIKNPGLKGN